MRGSSALSVCPFKKSLNSINSGETNSRSCELRAPVCAPEAPDSGSRARQAPIPRISLPLGVPCAHRVVASSKSESDSVYKAKVSRQQMNKCVAFMRPGNLVSGDLLWHRYFLPFSLLRYSVRSPPTPACATASVCKVCAACLRVIALYSRSDIALQSRRLGSAPSSSSPI